MMEGKSIKVMSLVQSVIQSYCPEDWEQGEYTGKRYLTFDLSTGDAEYRSVKESIGCLQIESVSRIQNPYLWGRYILRKEQMQLNGSVQESRMYHPATEGDIKNICEYNCDFRRYSHPMSDIQHYGKSMRFFSSASHAKQRAGTNVLIVVKVLHSGYNMSDYIDCTCDAEYCPEYIVRLL